MDSSLPVRLHHSVDAGQSSNFPETITLGGSGFVGRRHELAVIDAAVLQALEGRGHAVLISGEAGIGKSRLAQEALSLATTAGLKCLVGRFHDLPSNMAYLPFTRILGDVSSGRVGPDLARLLTLDPPGVNRGSVPAGVGDRTSLNEEIWDSLAGASLRQPLLLVLDDVHWADAASLSLLEFILPRVRSVPLVLLLLRRTVDPSVPSDRSQDLGYSFDWHSSHLTRCDLRGLTQEDVEQMLAQAVRQDLDDLRLELARATHRRAAGNPLFVEELLRHSIETGKAVELTGVSQSALLGVDAFELPPSLKEAINARLRLTSESCQRVLGYAAILGNTFDFDILATMAEGKEEDVILALEEAIRTQLIAESVARHGTDYEFRHEVVRQVLYENLSKPRRQKLHLRAATTLEQARGGESYEKIEQVARHCQLAGKYCDAAKAIDYSIQASSRAQELYAYDEAIAHLEWAVQLVERSGGDPVQQADLFDRLARLFFVTGQAVRGKEYTDRSIAVYRGMGMDELAATAHSRLVWQYSSNQESLDLPKARRELKAAADTFSSGPDRATVGYFHVGRAGAALWELRTTEGLEASRRAMEVASSLGDDALWSSAAGMHGWHLAMSGQIDEGMALSERAWQVADSLNNFVWTFRSAWYRGTMSYLIGDPLEARNWFQRESLRPHLARALTQKRSLLERLGNALSTMGNVDAAERVAKELDQQGVLDATICFRQGDWEGAELLWLEAKAKARLAGDAFDVWRANYRLAQLYQMRGELGRAVEILEECLTSTSDGAVVLEAHTRAKMTQVLSLQGNRNASLHRERLENLILGGSDWRGFMGHVLLARAAITRMDGDEHAWKSNLEAAFHVFDRFQNPWECIDILLLLAEHSRDREALQKAEALAIRIGAHGYWAMRRSYVHLGGRTAKRDALRLSARESQVLALLGAGKTNKEIAELLVISRHTAARHVSAILRKANLGNRTAAASLFAQLGQSVE